MTKRIDNINMPFTVKTCLNPHCLKMVGPYPIKMNIPQSINKCHLCDFIAIINNDGAIMDHMKRTWAIYNAQNIKKDKAQ